jgi:hypothetical protein
MNEVKIPPTNGLIKCECGGEKLGLPHSDWCITKQVEDFIKNPKVLKGKPWKIDFEPPTKEDIQDALKDIRDFVPDGTPADIGLGPEDEQETKNIHSRE